MSGLLPRLAVVLLATAAGGCSVLPSSGPATKAIVGMPAEAFRIVDVDAAVAHRLAARAVPPSFLASFGEGTPSHEVVGAGDQLEVTIWEAPPAVLFNSTLATGPALAAGVVTLPAQMVTNDGTITVPFAGTVPCAGRTRQDIEADILKRLAGKAHEPQVLVRLTANNTAYATVVGEVSTSVRLPLTPRGERVLDGLALAGGTKEPVDKMTLQLTRGDRVRALPLEFVIRDPAQNVRLQPGDVVTALFQPLSFTALGATGKADEINFESKGISLAQALARAGGLNDNRADAAGVFLFRFETPAADEPPGGVPTVDGRVPVIYRINLRDPRTFFVAQTFPMQNRDVLYVANAGAAELQKFLNLVVSTVYPIEGVVRLSK